MNTFLKNACSEAMSYAAYNVLLQNKAANLETTGKEQILEKIEFTKLNASRSKRLDKTLTLSDIAQNHFKKITQKQTWLVITESWCGDAAQTLPVLNNIAEVSSKINLKIVLRDENQTLMNEFLTNGTQSIPKLIILDEDYVVLDTWGSRSQAATQLVTVYKKEHGVIDSFFKKYLQIWYNKNKGTSIVEDLMALTKPFQVSESFTE